MVMFYLQPAVEPGVRTFNAADEKRPAQVSHIPYTWERTCCLSVPRGQLSCYSSVSPRIGAYCSKRPVALDLMLETSSMAPAVAQCPPLMQTGQGAKTVFEGAQVRHKTSSSTCKLKFQWYLDKFSRLLSGCTVGLAQACRWPMKYLQADCKQL